MTFKKIRQISKVTIAEIDKLSNSELEELIQECHQLSSTNCSWVMYGLKDIVIELAKCQIKWLKTETNLAIKRPKKK